MFDNLTERLSKTVRKLKGKGRLTEDSIREALREVRIALLEADVSLSVVQSFIALVRERALGREVLKSLSPGQALVKVVHEELVRVMGDENAALNLNAAAPVVVLLAGLQGSGKTTTTAKLARLLINEQNKKVMVVSCDVYRPAAIEQLATLAGQEFDGLPVDDIFERAGNVYFLSVKPKQEQQQQREAQKLSKRGLKSNGIAQKLGISLERVKKLLTG